MSTIEILEPRIAPAAIVHGHHFHALKQKKLNSDAHDRAVKFKFSGIKLVPVSNLFTSSGSSMEFYGGSLDLGFGASISTTPVSDATTSNAGALTLSSNATVSGGTLNLTKTGPGTAILTGNNTHALNTTVNTGQLILNGSATTVGTDDAAMTIPTTPGTIGAGTLTISGDSTPTGLTKSGPGNLVITSNILSNGTAGTVIAPMLILANPEYSGIATIVAGQSA